MLLPGVLILMLTFAAQANAQGCALCLDNTASTSPATQRAYGHAIELVSGAAAAFFLGALAIFKHNP